MNHVVRNVGLIFLAVVFCLCESNVGQTSAQGKKSRVQTTSPPVKQEAAGQRPEQPGAAPADPAMRDWLDSSTGLRWTNKDNGKDVTWKEAKDYCENLTLGGLKNWRLPAIEELVDIQAGTVGQNNPWRFKGNIRAADAVWSSSTSLSNDVWVYYPRAGRRDIDRRSPFNRVICVAEAIAGSIPSYPESTVTPQSVRRYDKDGYTYIDYESNVGPDFVPPIPSETKDKLAIRLRQQENLGSLSEIHVNSSPVYIQMGTDESKVDEVARIVSDDYRFYALNHSEKAWAPLLVCYYNQGDGRVTSRVYWFREIPASVVQNRNVIASHLRDHPLLQLTARTQCPAHPEPK